MTTGVDTPARLEEWYASHLLETVVVSTADGYRWRHRLPREDAATVPARARALEAAREDGVGREVLAWARWHDGWWVHTAPGGRSLADVVLDGGLDESAAPVLRAVGRALAELHRLRPDADGSDLGRLGPHVGLLRTRRWLDGLSPDFGPSHFAAQARDRVGDAVWGRVLDWCRDLQETPSPRVCHGGPGTGMVVPAPTDPTSCVVLTGAGLCLADPVLDTGHVLGELLEMWSADLLGEAALAALVGAFSDGYGRPLGAADHRAAVLRILQHQVDFVGNVGSVTPDVLRALRLVRYLVESGPVAPGPQEETVDDG